MSSRSVHRFALNGGILVGALIATASAAEGPPAPPIEPGRAVEPVTPALPAEVVAAMQEGPYAEAVTALDRLDRDPNTRPADRAYHSLIQGIAFRLGGKQDEARAALAAGLAADPGGPWVGQLRGALAAAELEAGRPAEAERLARAEVERLLAADRKDRLAGIDHAFALRLLHPDDPFVPPDPEGARTLLEQALHLARGDDLRARLRFELACASQEANQFPQAIADFQAYLADHSHGADRLAARFHLGEAQRAARRFAEARRTWTDLARDLEGQDDPDARDLRARSLYQIARTFGIPSPSDEVQLSLGVAALRRFLAVAPAHPLAVRAAYEIGESYAGRRQSQPAREALEAFLNGKDYRVETDEARREREELTRKATFQLGQILQGQGQFTEALDAFRSYLTQFPDGPQSADAQRAILDTQLLLAQDHLSHERYDEARTGWQAFAVQNPLDPRAPEALFQVGRSFAAQKKWDEAIAAWETLAGKFPKTPEAHRARFQVASILETEKGDPAAALERFRQLLHVPGWLMPDQADVRQRVAVMEATVLRVVTPRPFRSGETPRLEITTRNLERLTFRAYNLDAEDYFRKRHALNRVEDLDIALVAPDAEWTADVPGFAKYKPIETSYDLKEVAIPGVWVVRVTDENAVQATTLVVGSDLDAIVKTSRNQVLVFAQDMKTGQGRAGARVLVGSGSEILLEARTGPDGVLLADWDEARSPNSRLEYLVLDGPNSAGSGLGVPEQVAQGLSPRAYLYTDRPAYRPGQEVALRGVVRDVNEGQYAVEPGAAYRLEVLDPQGRRIMDRGVNLSEFGTFHQRLPLEESAAVGTYRVRLYRPGRDEFAGSFEVRAYQLGKVDLSWDLPRTVFYRGETIAAAVVAAYQGGPPLAGRPITVSLPDGRELQGRTDPVGRFHVELTTEGFAEEQELRFEARLPEEDTSATATVLLALRGFRIDLSTPRDVYLDGERFSLDATTLDARGEPTGQELTVSVLKQVTRAGQVSEREVAKESLTTDPQTGRGSVALKIDDEEGGRYLLRTLGTDRFGNPVVADRALTISGRGDENRLRLLADRTSFRIGEPAEVRLHSRSEPGTALLTWEADRILKYKIMTVQPGENPISWEVEGPQFPNFTLTASQMAGTRFNQARLDLRAERDLRVTLKPARPTVGPGAEVELEVTTTDQLGRPVAAELSLALVDRALLRLYDDRLPPIGLFFYDQVRTGTFATEATNTFRYAPRTLPITEEVVQAARSAPALAPGSARGFGIHAGGNPPVEPPKPATPGEPVSGPFWVDDDPRSRALLARLEQVVPMSFPQETPLGDILKYIKTSLQVPDSPPLPIYVDPIGLQEAEATEDSTITLDLEGLPLRTTLDLVLNQIGLCYLIHDGLLHISSTDSEDFGLDAVTNAKFKADLVERLRPYGARLDYDGAIVFGDENLENRDGMRFGGMGGMGMTFGGEGMGGIGGGFRGGGNGPANRLPRSAAPEREAPARPEPKPAPGRGGLALGDNPEQAPPRQQFLETAYWNPSVVTDQTGKARVTFRAPSALSRYRFTARGVTGAETLVGQATADLTVKQDFYVDLKRPAALVEGDRPRFAARVHHVGVAGPASLRLTIYAGGRKTVLPRNIEWQGDGVEEVLFDSYEVSDGDSVRLTLSARAGDDSDELTAEVPIHPWGVQAAATAGGTASNDATAFVELPAGRDYEQPEMVINISPTVRGMLVDLALGGDSTACGTVADRASELLAAASAWQGLKATGWGSGPEFDRLVRRIEARVSELIGLQNQDGGWPWVAGQTWQPSERMTSARAVWALAEAGSLGLVPDPKVFDRAIGYLENQLAGLRAGDQEARAALLFALSTRNRAGFEQVNALNRVRRDLPDVALAYLALTFDRLDRRALALEVLDVLAPRGRIEPAAAPTDRPGRFWGAAASSCPWHDPTETTALAALAFARVRPEAPERTGAVEWLLSHRIGTGWQPARAGGPALAALAATYGQAERTEDRYRLVVSVNDQEVERFEVSGPAEGRTVAVPRKLLKPGRNRVHFDIEGRGTFGYSVTLTGFARDFRPDQDPVGRSFLITSRVYEPGVPRLDGRALPVGFDVAVNPVRFENQATQVPLGGQVQVRIEARRVPAADRPGGDREFLILEEPLPAGTTLVEGSVVSPASRYDLADGLLTFYFAPDQAPGPIHYQVYGHLPGPYRVLPPRLHSASDPGRQHLGPEGTLTILPPGEESTDPYKPTPDELYARGRAYFDAGRLDQAAASLEELFNRYTLISDVLKEVARMLLYIHLEQGRSREVVRDFEVIREKAPELVIPFDKLLAIGRAYAEIGEHERATLGWRALAEASYLEDAQVGQTLQSRGQTLEGVAYLLDLWRTYPDEASIRGDFFALAQLLAGLATRSDSDPAARQELERAGLARTDLLQQSIRLLNVFLTQAPRDPQADEASLALVGAHLDQSDYPTAVDLARRFTALYPKSPYLDSFQYAEALGCFHLAEYDRAIAVAEAIAAATYPDANGVDQPSPNKWQALYILGQIHDARRQPDRALTYYRQVADRFSDAADAVEALTRKELALPELSVLRPGGQPADDPDRPGIELTYRNIAQAEVKVYPVDLMQLYQSRRRLDAVARVELAGIRPRHRETIPLGPGTDFADQTRTLDLPLKEEGAYLVVVRGEDRYASGIVLVTSLDLEVRSLPDRARLRIAARDEATGSAVPGVEVRVLGTGGGVSSGRTDLRGVFVAENLRGAMTAVARQGAHRFAVTRVPAVSNLSEAAEPSAPVPDAGGPSDLNESLRSRNRANRDRQVNQFRGRHGSMGGMGGMMGGGFR